MHDYILSALARDRTAGFLREVEHDELVAEAKRAADQGPVQDTSRTLVTASADRSRWKARLAHPHLPSLHLPLHHA